VSFDQRPVTFYPELSFPINADISNLSTIMPDDSELKKYIKKLESRIEALEKSAEDRVHSFSEKWFKRSPTETAPPKTTDTHGDNELRMVLMGPPGAGNCPRSQLCFCELTLC
jgi:hypothetical protein